MRTIALALLLLAPIVVHAQTRTVTSEAPAIRVTGTGRATGNPDLLQMHIAVLTQDASAQNAATRNAATVAKVLAALQAQLSAGSQITTLAYSLEPNYVYAQDGSRPRIDGYNVVNTLKVETADLNKAGAIIDAAIGAGATSIYNITYTQRDPSALRASALAAAAVEARAKGETLARAMGLPLGAVRLIEETVQVAHPMMDYEERADIAGDTSIRSGPVETHATVTITFDINR